MGNSWIIALILILYEIYSKFASQQTLNLNITLSLLCSSSIDIHVPTSSSLGNKSKLQSSFRSRLYWIPVICEIAFIDYGKAFDCVYSILVLKLLQFQPKSVNYVVPLTCAYYLHFLLFMMWPKPCEILCLFVSKEKSYNCEISQS